MTHPDDHVRLNLPDGTSATYFCSTLKLHWPPPEKVKVRGVVFKRVRMSNITDEQIFKMDNVARGAEYEPMDS